MRKRVLIRTGYDRVEEFIVDEWYIVRDGNIYCGNDKGDSPKAEICVQAKSTNEALPRVCVKEY